LIKTFESNFKIEFRNINSKNSTCDCLASLLATLKQGDPHFKILPTSPASNLPTIVTIAVPFPDVAGEERGSCDDDEADVDELGWVGVSAELAASAMFAYSLMAVITVVMGLAWLYIVVSSAALAEVRVWGVMAP
jgi:hypothetical protein